MIKKIGTLLLVIAVLTGCSSDDSSNSPNSFNPDDYLYYITGKINGEDFVYGQLASANTLDYSQAGFGNSIISNCAFNPTIGGVNYAMGVYPNLDSEDRPSMYFDFVRFFLCDPNFNNDPQSTFNESFPVGSYTTAMSGDDNSGTTGAVGVTYTPDSTVNTYYQSFNDNQTGNTFEITSSVNSNQNFGAFTNYIQLLEGNFNFTLYNSEDPSDTIEITEGSFKLFMTLD